ncbi:hypothetical protein ABZ479_34450 [Streptomyces sp. NPDC005722]
MPGSEDESSRERLGRMLRDLLKESSLNLREACAVVAGGQLTTRTLRNWRDGISVPAATERQEQLFWALVHQLQMRTDRSYSDAAWQTVLREAQLDGSERRGWNSGLLKARAEGDLPFFRPHLSRLRAKDPLAGRQDEQAAMNAFARATGPHAPPYLCWHAERKVGKTALLADYVHNRPRGVDVLNFFISDMWGTNTRAAFTAKIAEQIQAFLYPTRPSFDAPRGPVAWEALFNRAAAKSAKHGRVLLLVVDGLNEDIGWAAPDKSHGGKRSGDEARRGVRTRSIAALLPAHPHANLRIIVSTRRTLPLPSDLPAGHPLRQRECHRILGPSERAAEIGQATRAEADRLRASELGRTVLNLLALSGGGLRIADLAELADVPGDQVSRLLQGPGGHCIVLDDPVTDTYTLGDGDIARSVRQELGAHGLAHHSGLLHTWADAWRTASWPQGTPPYLLGGYLRLLDGPARREEYVLDPGRQVRLAATAGCDTALAQLDALASEPAVSRKGIPSPERLGTAALIAVSRAVLLAGTRQVPGEAPVLFVQLGDVARARTLARSVADPVPRAARLTQVAVAVSRAGLPGAASIAHEAVEAVTSADRIFPCPPQDADAYEEIAEAARALHAHHETDAACALLRAVVRSGTITVETLVACVGVLAEHDDSQDWLAAVEAQADDLSMGTMRAKAAAADIWVVLAHHVASRRVWALERIRSLCDDLEPSDGLAALDIIAIAITTLHKYPAVVRKLMRTAVDQLSAALADPDTLSPADQAHLRRELGTTLERLSRAVKSAPTGRYALEDLRSLVAAHRQHLRAGLLGDDLAERAEANLTADQDQKAPHQTGKGKASRTRAASQAHAEPNNDHPEHGTQQEEHIALLQEAKLLLHNGNSLLGRERLEKAIRRAPVRDPSASTPDWTPALAQALGAVGDVTEADKLLCTLAEPAARAAHAAAVSMGCSLTGRGIQAGQYAREAARLAADTPNPDLRGTIAQALAHAGETTTAVRMAEQQAPYNTTAAGQHRTQTRQTLTAVAAGLAHHDPTTATQLIEPLAEKLMLRIARGSPLNPLPHIAALLLALPDPRQPSPRLRQALDLACAAVHEPRQQWHPQTMAILALLHTLRCCPENPGLADTVDQWRHTLPPDQIPHAELAVLKAVEGDTAEALRLAHAATTPHARANALAAIATHLAGIPVPVTTNPASPNTTTRLCLALAHAAGTNTTPDESTARTLTQELLASEHWTHTIPLLPQLAPKALNPLSKLTRTHSLTNKPA